MRLTSVLLAVAVLTGSLPACGPATKHPALPAAPGPEPPAHHEVAGWVPVEEDVALHYRIVGRGPEVLVVPNGSQLGELARLAGGRRVLLVDGRGRGRSDAVEDPERIGVERDVEDLEALRRALGLERISLLGASYYGAVAALYAAAHPERVDRLVMAAPLPMAVDHFPPMEEEEELAPELAELRRQRVHVRDPAAYCRAYYRSEVATFFHDPRAVERMDLGFCELPNEWPDRFEAWAERIFASIPGWDWSSRAAAVPAPVLVIQGRNDRVVPPPAARHWVAALPRARLLELPASGHLPWIEQPEAFFAAVETFLDGGWPARAVDVPAPPPA